MYTLDIVIIDGWYSSQRCSLVRSIESIAKFTTYLCLDVSWLCGFCCCSVTIETLLRSADIIYTKQQQQQQPKHFTYIHNNNICSKSPVDFCHNTDRFLCVILKYSSSTNYQHIRCQMKTISLFPFQTLINLLSFGFSPHMCPQQTLFATDK